MKTKLLYLLITCCTICACSNYNNTPNNNNTQFDNYFDTLIIKNHGQYYANRGITQQVISLDFYSQGLSFDSIGKLYGTGTNLYFSDIFLPDSITYLPTDTTFLCDTTALPFTFIPGLNCEGTFSGAYLLYINDSKLQNITLIPQGTIHVNQDSTITFNLYLNKQTTYQATYEPTR